MSETAVSFTSVEAYRHFPQPPGHGSMSFPVDIVTAIKIGDEPRVDFRADFEIKTTRTPRQSEYLLPTAIAARLGQFCVANYCRTLGQPEFDCYSALTFWTGRTPKVQLGIGTSAFAAQDISGIDRRHHAKRGQPYLVTDAENNLNWGHAYLGLGHDSAGLGRNTLSAHGINGPLLLAPAYALAQAYGAGSPKVSRLRSR